MEKTKKKTTQKTADNGKDRERKDAGKDAGSESDTASGSGSAGGSGSSRCEGTGAAAGTRGFFRKRSRPKDDRGSSSEGELASARKIPTSKRGGIRARGRRLSTTEGSARLAEEGCHPGVAGHGAALSGSSGDEAGAAGGSEMERKARFAKEVEAAIRGVAMKKLPSSKLRAIPGASASIMAAAEASFAGTSPGEVAKLRAEVARLTAAMELLREENEKLRADLAGLRESGSREVPQGRGQQRPSQPVPVENQVLDLVRQEMAAFQARFSVLEGIVLRPPLAANKAAPGPGQRAASYAAAAAATPGPGRSTQPSGRAVSAPGKPAPAKPVPAKKKAAQKKKGRAVQPPTVAIGPAPATGLPLPPPPPLPKPPAAEAGWQVVGEKRKGRKAAKKARNEERRRRHKAQSVAARLRAPKTAAVVITLQPDAEKRGVSYRDVLAKAKAAVNLGELGIAGGLRLKVSATGARVLEIPGETSGSSADALAEKLRASLDADEARVSRPVRCADLRILGLDDSVTEEEVVAAVTRTGGCPAEQVKAGTLRPDLSGMRTVTVSCPVTAAKTIVEGRRLLVGWVSAQVKLLEPRPLRCYRCHVGHHVSVKCTSEVDRSGLCFRCGQPGHMAAACFAMPHCAACAGAGKPADHRAGSKACAPPAKARGRGRPSATTPTVAIAAAAATVAAAAATTAVAATPAAGPSQGAREGGAEMECQ